MDFWSFDWPSFDPLQGIYAQLGSVGRTKYPPTVTDPLRAAAKSCGLNPDLGYIWGIVKQVRNERGEPFHMAIIGDTQNIVADPNKWLYSFVPRDEEPIFPQQHSNLFFDPLPGKESLTVQPWHIVLKPAGGRIELHQKFQVNLLRPRPTLLAELEPETTMLLGPSGPETVVLNAEVTKKSDLDVLWELYKLLHIFQRDRGRPKGTTNYSDDEAEENIRQVEAKLRTGEYKYIKHAAAAVYGQEADYAAKLYARDQKRIKTK